MEILTKILALEKALDLFKNSYNASGNPEDKNKIDTLKTWINELNNTLNPKPIIDNTIINEGLL